MSEDLVIRLCDERAALQDEVAKLQHHVKMLEVELDGSEKDHEATKAELDRYATALGAAEARVAELERIHEQALNERDAAHDALSSARALLERCRRHLDERDSQCMAFDNEVFAWLRTHPAPATSCPECGMTVQHKLQCSRRWGLVPAADVVTPEERAVLEACATAEVAQLSNGWRMLDGDSNRAVTAAELARRAAKEAK